MAVAFSHAFGSFWCSFSALTSLLLAELELQVWGGGPAALAHVAYGLAGAHRFPRHHGDVEKMGVEGAPAAPVIQHHGSHLGGQYCRSCRHDQILAGVRSPGLA